MPTQQALQSALAVAIASLTLASSGCAPVPAAVEMGFRHPVWTDDGLYLVEREGPGALFVASPPLGIERYRSIIVDEIWLGFKQGGPAFDAAEREKLQVLVRRNLQRRLASQGWQPVDEAGPDTLRMRVAISQIDYSPIELYGASSVSLRASGGAAITAEIRDSLDGRRFFIYAQHRQLPYAAYGGPGRVNVERVADAFYEYALDLKRYIGKAQGGQLPGPGSDARLARRGP